MSKLAMKSFIKKRDEYFLTRFPGAEGISDSFLAQKSKRNENSIIVDHNDYLGNGSSETMMMSGIFIEGASDSHQHRVRKYIADFVRMPACHVAQSGMDANVNIVETLYSKGIPVYIDQFAHASFWKGIACCGGKRDVHRFRHNDLDHLKSLTTKYGPGLILVESLYSTSGSLAPLVEMATLSKEGGHILVVDESHSLGLYGEEGSGYCSMLGVVPDFITASLSKAVGVRAGVVLGDARSLKYMAEVATTAIFSSVVEPKTFVAIEKSIESLRRKDLERERIMQVSTYIREKLQGTYGVVSTPHPSPIFGLVFKTERETDTFQKYLQPNGVFGAVFCYPATPLSGSLVRLTINSSVTMKRAKRIVRVVKGYNASL